MWQNAKCTHTHTHTHTATHKSARTVVHTFTHAHTHFPPSPPRRVAYVAQHAFHHLEECLDISPARYILRRYSGGEDK